MKVTALLLTFVLFMVSKEYFDHLKAYSEHSIVHATVIKKHCKRKGSSNIDIKYKGQTYFVEVLGGSCSNIKVGQTIDVLVSPWSGKVYWNTKPTGRVFFLYPFIITLIVFALYWDRKRAST